MKIAFMFRSLLLCFLGLCLATRAYAVDPKGQNISEPDWQDFMSVVGEYQVSFPGYAQHVSENVRIKDTEHYIKYDAYIAQKGVEALYMVLIAQYPKGHTMGSGDDALKAFISGIMSQSQDSELGYINFHTFQGHSAVDFMVETAGVYLKGKAIMVGDNLYLIATEGHKAHFSEKDHERFMGSFKLLK